MGTTSRPIRGVGISLRAKHYAQALETMRRIDWLEVQPENFMGMGGEPRRFFEAFCERWPVALHGVALSLGGPDPLDQDYLAELEPLLALSTAGVFSEHVSYARIGGTHFHELLPLPRSRAAVEHVAERTRQLRARLGCDVWLENPSTYTEAPGGELDEGAFLAQVLACAEAGMVLDVNNIFVNACNFGLSPSQLLRSMPLDRTREIHLAGHRRMNGWLLDDHGSAIAAEVWALYKEALTLVGPVPTLIEWENNLPELDRVLDEADHARRLLDACVPQSTRGAA